SFLPQLPASHYFLERYRHTRVLHSFPTRRSSDLAGLEAVVDSARESLFRLEPCRQVRLFFYIAGAVGHAVHELLEEFVYGVPDRSGEHTSELQSRGHLVCRLLLEKKKKDES